jgi:sirohydrochlorin cobaltochelatase
LANRLTFTLSEALIDPQLISQLEISSDRLPSAARNLLTRLTTESAAGTAAGVSAAAPMPAAPFVWRADGRPDWGSMWTSFCDLALFGGPPHRPRDKPVRYVPDTSAPSSQPAFDAAGELQRGIWETTHLVSEPSEDGWVAIVCHSARMAEWLCTAIVLENVQARAQGNLLLVPACHGFTLESEVKSVITVVAKTAHYWEQHIAGI